MGKIVVDTLTPNLKRFDENLDRGLKGITEYQANASQNAMRTGARWTDRTINARNGLFAKAVHEKLHHVIVLYHTVPYGIWLEVANDKKYQIIMPTVLSQGRATMALCKGLLDRLGVK